MYGYGGEEQDGGEEGEEGISTHPLQHTPHLGEVRAGTSDMTERRGEERRSWEIREYRCKTWI